MGGGQWPVDWTLPARTFTMTVTDNGILGAPGRGLGAQTRIASGGRPDFVSHFKVLLEVRSGREGEGRAVVVGEMGRGSVVNR